MDSLRKVEEDLRNIAIEFKKKYPEVIDATERALATLKTMREMYVADKMRKSGVEKEDVKIPQSSDILSPYILACNYADANPKLLLLALSGIQLLVGYEMIPPSDVKNVLRVFSIQVGTGKAEIQLKILQILLHLANMLAVTDSSAHYLNEATLKTFFTLTLGLCETKSAVSVSTTAQATIRQLISIIMDPLMLASTLPSSSSSEVKANYQSCGLSLGTDLVLCCQNEAGEWCRGVQVPANTAFDLLDYIITGWTELFLRVPSYRGFMKNVVFVMLKPMLRTLQEDFAKSVVKDGCTAASAHASRVVRLARFFLLHLCVQDFIDEIDLVVTLMVHTLTSDFDLDGHGGSSGRSSSMNSTDDEKEATEAPASGGMMGGASALFGGLARFQFGSKDKPSAPTGNAALQASYLSLRRSTSGGSFLASENSPASMKPSSRLLAHPAGACLEALISFFLSDLMPLSALQGGKAVISNAMTNTVISATAVISQALAVEANVKLFVDAVRESKVITLLEGLMSNKEMDTAVVVRTIHDCTMQSTTISGAETLILAFSVIQVVVRHLVEFTLEGIDHMCSNSASRFLDEFKVMRRWKAMDAKETAVLQDIAKTVGESVYENIQEAISASLSHVHYPAIVRRSVGIMSEMALVTGLLSLARPCEVLIASLCHYTVPRWHGHDGYQSGGNPAKDVKGEREVETFKWENVQAIVRLSQTVHVLADAISDWDSIVDAFEQITDCILNPKTVLADDVTSTEVEKVIMALERFKNYTVFLSDESLIKLMTSLVALSLNNLAVTARSVATGDSSDNLNARLTEGMTLVFSVRNKPRRAPAYMVDGIVAGYVSFSLQATVEVAKSNMHRISCIWQMVTSHLKMISSLKSGGVRAVAVASTHDLITSALKHLYNSSVPAPETIVESSKKPATKAHEDKRSACLSDEVLFTHVIPSFESVFMARKAHVVVLHSQVAHRVSRELELSQSDLFSSLRFLASIRFDDVKINIMQGLLLLLQGGCEVLSEDGWASVIALIAEVPSSLVERDDTTDSRDSMDGSDQRWPVEALVGAFNCMKLILDEYLELVSLVSTTSIISCLSSFSSQMLDVNISLTSLEMLWKVYDQMMRSSGGQGDTAQAVFDITTKQLLVLSMDIRPEIRHCAMNTLFAALTMTANASLTSGGQWKQIFDDVIFPLFERAGQRSHRAMTLKEEANAPELKKGKKMILHHSRDTAHKQWSETRVLALRGLARVVKTCAVLLIQETWFKSTWATALEVCKKTTQAATSDQEVAVASFDVMFAMLKIVSETNFKTLVKKEQLAEGIEACRKDMWQATWNAVTDAAKYNGQCSDLALHICQSIMTIFNESANQEFSHMQNLRSVCELLATLARPRISSDGEGSAVGNRSKVTDMQLYRVIQEFLKVLTPKSVESATLIASAIVELCFSNQYAQMQSPINGEKICMAPCPQKFREEVGEFFMKSFLPTCSKIADKECVISLVDTVFRRFISDMCGSAISRRSEALLSNVATPHTKTRSGSAEAHTQKSGGSSAGKELSFFSFLSGATSFDEEEETGKELFSEEENGDEIEQDYNADDERRTPSKIDPSFHALRQYVVPDKQQSYSWTAFYPLTVELKVLAKTLEHCVKSTNFEDISEPTRENIFSSLLCLMSPWRLQELPGAKNSHGSFVAASRPMQESQTSILNILDAIAIANPKSNWTVALISALVDVMKLQILAIAESDQEAANTAEDVTGTLNMWKKCAQILTNAATKSPGVNSRKVAVASLIILTKDISYWVLDKKKSKHVKALFEEGCIIFLRCLLQLETQMNDMPKGFNARRTAEKEILDSWLGNLTNPPMEAANHANVTTDTEEDTKASFSKTGHLFIFLPIAFQLHQCDCEEIKDIVAIITSSVDIAALLTSYTELQAQIETFISHEKTSEKK